MALAIVVSVIQTRDEPGLNVPSEFPTVQAALDQAKPQDLVLVDASQGPYRETLLLATPQVEIRSIKGRAVIEGTFSDPQVVNIQADEVTFAGFEVRGGGTGILAGNAEHIVLQDNVVVDNFGIGIMLFAISNSRLEGNISRKNLHGIWLSHGSNGNTLKNNVAQLNQGIGLSLNDANRNELRDGLWVENQTGVNFSASTGNAFFHNTIRKNQSGIILEDASAENVFELNLIEKNTQGIAMINVHSNRFERNRLLWNFAEGIVAEVTSQNEIRANLLQNNGTGIRLVNSSSNTVSGNTIETNRVGLHLLGSSRNNNITGNNFQGNTTLALSNDTSDIVMASGNYWGDPAGARLDSDAAGTGGLLAGAVMFAPWLSEPVQFSIAAKLEGDN